MSNQKLESDSDNSDGEFDNILYYEISDEDVDNEMDNEI